MKRRRAEPVGVRTPLAATMDAKVTDRCLEEGRRRTPCPQVGSGRTAWALARQPGELQINSDRSNGSELRAA